MCHFADTPGVGMAGCEFADHTPEKVTAGDGENENIVGNFALHGVDEEPDGGSLPTTGWRTVEDLVGQPRVRNRVIEDAASEFHERALVCVHGQFAVKNLLDGLKTLVSRDGLKDGTVESGTPIFGTHNSVVDLDV